MDILKVTARSLLVLLVLAFTSCFLVDQWMGDRGPYFSHAVHVVEEGLDCALCHTQAEDPESIAAGMPVINQCNLCHEDIDAEKEPGRRAADFFAEDGSFKRRPRTPLPADVRFAHGTHVDTYEVSCEECHGDIGQSERIPATAAVTKSDCMDCHASAGLGNACTDCHQEIDASWTPSSHLMSWDLLHGSVSRNPGPASANRCDLCHSESTCTACHQETAPRDHNNYWRHRGHGISVSMDRSRCTTCHRTDSCDRCHSETSPRSHRGSFGAPLNRHCVQCHFPLQQEGCFTCHKGAPSHAMAPPLPGTAAHINATDADCRVCHAPPDLGHPDNGDSCRICHK